MTVPATSAALTARTPAAKPRADIWLSLKDAKAKAADILRTASPATTTALAQSRDLAQSAVKARQDARDAKKTQAHQDVIRLREQFKLIKKIYANNPQEMARQLGKIFKELKTALKAYAEATKGDPAPQPPAAPEDAEGARVNEATADADKKSGDDAPTDGDAQPSKEAATDAAAREEFRALIREGVNAYQKQSTDEHRFVRAHRAEEAQGTLAFLDEVRGLVKDIVKTYVEAKIKAAFLGKGRDERSEPFKEADKALKALEEAMTDIETDAKADLLPPDMKASATA